MLDVFAKNAKGKGECGSRISSESHGDSRGFNKEPSNVLA